MTLTPTQRPTSMTNELHPGEVLTAETVGTNSGHGYVWARPDGVKMRCGGPRMCAQCAKDAARLAEVVEVGKSALSASDEGRDSAHPQEAASVPGEGGEPVAWRYEAELPGRDRSKVWRVCQSADEVENLHDAGIAVQPLFTSPPAGKDLAGDLKVALTEAADAIRFFDKVKAATQDEKIAVGQDHWNRLEAALRALAALGEGE